MEKLLVATDYVSKYRRQSGFIERITKPRHDKNIPSKIFFQKKEKKTKQLNTKKKHIILSKQRAILNMHLSLILFE